MLEHEPSSCRTRRPLRLPSGFAIAVLLCLWGMLSVAAAALAAETTLQARQTFDFPEAGVAFSNCFPAARLNDCIQVSRNEYRLVILPENRPINDSPWYAFRVSSQSPRKLIVKLTYQGGGHRYHPKISPDGVTWTLLERQAYIHDKVSRQAVMWLDVGPEPLWVAAQELITGSQLEAWSDRMAALSFVSKSVIGHSALGWPIWKLETSGAENRRYVFIIGRQHPPEVTGSLGLMHFTETVLGDSPIAAEFRRRYNLIVVPLANPDGVQAGHWRHNINGVDLNRDWGEFLQPETWALRQELMRFASTTGPRLYLFLDFHSTHQDVFYTQSDENKTTPEDFTRKWLGAIQARFPDYKVRRVGSHGPTLRTSKRWVYHALGIPSITYELGDNTDRELISTISRGAAEEMMRLLLIEDEVVQQPVVLQ